MKKILFLLSAIMLSVGAADAQLGNLAGRLANKAINKATDKAIDKATDKAVDKLFEDKESKSETTEPSTPAATAAPIDWAELDAIVLPAATAAPTALNAEIARIDRLLPALPTIDKLLSNSAKEYSDFDEALSKAQDELDAFETKIEEQYGEKCQQITSAQLVKSMGLTADDLKKLEDPNLSAAEREQLQAKVYASAMTGAATSSAVDNSDQSILNRYDSAIVARETKFASIALSAQTNCEMELASINTKRELAASSGRKKQLDEQITARRRQTSRQLAEHNLCEIEWRLKAQRARLDEAAECNKRLLKMYENPSERQTMADYSTLTSQIEYLRNVINVYRSAWAYSE